MQVFLEDDCSNTVATQQAHHTDEEVYVGPQALNNGSCLEGKQTIKGVNVGLYYVVVGFDAWKAFDSSHSISFPPGFGPMHEVHSNELRSHGHDNLKVV